MTYCPVTQNPIISLERRSPVLDHPFFKQSSKACEHLISTLTPKDFKIDLKNMDLRLLLTNDLEDSFFESKMRTLTTFTPPPPRFNFEVMLISNDFINASKTRDLCLFLICDVEDSFLRKIIACIPLIGILPAEMAFCSLRRKMRNTNEPKRNITLLEITNDYKACSTARAVFTVAITVIALSFQILSTPIAIGLILASYCSAARSVCDGIANAKMMRAFEFAASQEID